MVWFYFLTFLALNGRETMDNGQWTTDNGGCAAGAAEIAHRI
jgi:hypothetical protein